MISVFFKDAGVCPFVLVRILEQIIHMASEASQLHRISPDEMKIPPNYKIMINIKQSEVK